MKTPPEMLSPKDCSYLSDLLETTLTLAKRARDDAAQIEDDDIKQCAKVHEKRFAEQYATLLELLK